MTANKKPDLGDSLAKVLSPRKKQFESHDVASGNDSRNENVTPIDSVGAPVKTVEEITDPFSEAEKEYKDEAISVIDESPETEHVLKIDKPESDDSQTQKVHDLKPERVIKSKPEKQTLNKLKRNSEPKDTGKVLLGTAIILSIMAIGVSGYSLQSQDGIKEKLEEGMASIESSIANLNDRTDLFELSISGFKQSISDNSTGIAKLEDLQRNDVLQLKESINAIRSEADQVKELLRVQKTTVDEHGKLIKDIQSDVKQLASRPKPSTNKQVVKVKPKAVEMNSNSIEGAILSTIDRWGSSSYVVLRDESGNWIPLQRGDNYKGWRYSGSTGNEALFKKGSETKKLTVES